MNTTRPDHRSPQHRAAERIALARANRPATDHNGHPLPGQPKRVFRYGHDGLLDGAEPEPDDDGQQ